MDVPGFQTLPLIPILLPLLAEKRSGNLDTTTQAGAEITTHRLCFVKSRNQGSGRREAGLCESAAAALHSWGSVAGLLQVECPEDL